MEIDKRFLPELNPHDAYIETVMKFPGIPPWQINRGPVVQAYNPRDTGDKGVTGERSQEECNTQLYQLSEAILMDLKNIKLKFSAGYGFEACPWSKLLYLRKWGTQGSSS